MIDIKTLKEIDIAFVPREKQVCAPTVASNTTANSQNVMV